MAPSFISAVVLILAQVLELLGVRVGSEELTTTILTLITIGSGLVIAIRQVVTKRSTVFGVRP